MKISIATDHAGFELKNFLVEALRAKGHDVHDHGAHELVPEDDYPTYIGKVAQDISKYEEARWKKQDSTHSTEGREKHTDGLPEHMGIVIGGSGQGEAITANKYPYVRAALVYGGVSAGGSMHLIESIAKLSREHNDANVLSLGARFLTNEEALHIVEIWLATKFIHEERHVRRINEITQIETS